MSAVIISPNKDVDLNTTEISDHISLEEKFETNLDVISRYLDIRDICNLMLINKECFKTLVDILESKTEISIDLLEEEIKKLKEINPNIAFDTLKKKPIKLSVNSMRAISLLNSSAKCFNSFIWALFDNLLNFSTSDSISLSSNGIFDLIIFNKELYLLFKQ